MNLRPEQLRALAYARKRGTDAPLHDIRMRVSGTYADFEAIVDGLSAEVARQHHPTSGWCIQEVVDHLVESERRATEQLAALLAGHDVETPIPAGLQSADPHAHGWPELVQQLRTVHENVVDLLSRASDGHPLTARGAVEMVVKCARPDGTLEPVTWVERFDWKAYAILLHAHNREHIGQVQRILGALSQSPQLPQPS